MAVPVLTLEQAKAILDEAENTATSERWSRINPRFTKRQMWNLLYNLVTKAEESGLRERNVTWHIISNNIRREFVKPETAWDRLKGENARLRMRVKELEAALADGD